MTNRSDLLTSWEKLIIEGASQQKEVQGKFPFRIMYGSDVLDRPIFFIITETKPGLIKLSSLVDVERGQRTIDHRWTLAVILKDSGFKSIFMQLAIDLIDAAEGAPSETVGMRMILDALEDWRSILTYGERGRLSRAQVRGLVAELWFGFLSPTLQLSMRERLLAWTGPLGSPQDFNLPTGSCYEVKAIHPDSQTIQISSAFQLDPQGRDLKLVTIILVDSASNDDPAVTTLPSVCSHIKECLGSDRALLTQFDAKLDAVGYCVEDEYYNEMAFNIIGEKSYNIDSGFPCIRVSDISLAVTDVRYRIKIAALQDFEETNDPSI